MSKTSSINIFPQLTKQLSDHAAHHDPTLKRFPVTSIPRSWIFPAWLGIFYVCWLGIVLASDLLTVIGEHWGIAAAMAPGSYVAGSTPMGGGTVGFPVLVLLFDQSGAIGRDFAFAIQSIGMVSASIYILTRPSEMTGEAKQDNGHTTSRQFGSLLDETPTRAGSQTFESKTTLKGKAALESDSALDWGLIRPALIGSLISTPLGVTFLAPRLPDLSVKLIFAVIWASFGLMHLIKIREFVSYSGQSSRWLTHRGRSGRAVGLLGGLISSITGVGIDMLLYATMVLMFQSDLKISTPSSVIVMAFTSVVGIASTLALSWLSPGRFSIDPEVFQCWIAAAPVVALGAPIGAWAVQRLPKVPTLVLISILCLIQFVWTLLEEQVSPAGSLTAIASVLLMNLAFHTLYRLGRPSPTTVETQLKSA
ncbi:MAG: sulfite exporter TauE/SafE family protein [Rubripirellula sp.]|nr:sulfite exporter TauE/SafE family protein [Rubripirellula sp.]